MKDIVFLNFPIERKLKDAARVKALLAGQTLKEYLTEAVMEKNNRKAVK